VRLSADCCLDKEKTARRQDMKGKPWTMRNVVGMASVASKWKNSAFEQDSCRRVMGEEERGVHILLRWKSSLWKLVWRQLLIYLVIYFSISLLYRCVLLQQDNPECKKGDSKVDQKSDCAFTLYDSNGQPQNCTLNQKPEECDERSHHRQQFEKVVEWLRTGERLPLTFLLGFYVSLVVKRWWDQYIKLPWPDEVATLLKAGLVNPVEGDDARQNERIRRTVVRYLVLAYVLCLRRISSRVRNRCPDMDSLLASALIRKDEVALIGDEEQCKIGRHGGHVTVPLVYTQVVHLAVYFYFAAALIGRQSIITEERGDTYQSYTPMFLIAEFIFYFGWLNVAATLYNPFGDDDDDFELMGLVNRHIRVCMEMVNDDREGQVPNVEDDLFWQPPVDAPKDWKPTFEIRPTQSQPGRSFSIKGLLNRNGRVVFPSEEEAASMQVESRDQGGLVRRSSKPSKQTHRPKDMVFQQSLEDVVEVEPPPAAPIS